MLDELWVGGTKGRGVWTLSHSLVGFNQIALKQGSDSPTAVSEFLSVRYFIFWHFTMHYQHFGLSRGHETFSGETASAIKDQKKKKSEVRGTLFLQAAALIWLFFLFINPDGESRG